MIVEFALGKVEKGGAVKEAVPDESGLCPRKAESFSNVTIPVGTVGPLPATVAVMVTVWSENDGLGDAETVVVVD